MRPDVERVSGSLFRSDANSRAETLTNFILAVFGFSFWFFMVVPFASHRESYWWLATVHNQPLVQAFGYISSTYRPLAQVTTWLAFLFLDPSIFPTSVIRQILLQCFVYAMFVLAWWFIYSAAASRRLFAVVAFITGGVFFSGYVHLFHVYGIFYVPVILTLGAILHCYISDTFKKWEAWFAVAATLLVFWHPFATALFVGFYFGYYLETFRHRSTGQHVQSVVTLLVGLLAIAGMVVIFPRVTSMTGTFPRTAALPVDTRLFGFLVSYQTNEVNVLASVVAFLLAQMVLFSLELTPRLKLIAAIFVSVLGGVFLWQDLPLLLLWFFAVLMKLFRIRCWSLFFLMLTAALLPFGGGIGTPIYALFAIVVATYVTPLGWSQAEQVFSLIKTKYVMGTLAVLTAVLLIIRLGIEVPIVTRVARPLLTERERTYQLENILTWLHNSEYCGYQLAFSENAGSPINSVESAISRRYRPPAALGDVQLFWNTDLQCKKAETSRNKAGTPIAIVTFGGPELANLSPVFKVHGRYAGDATVWVQDSRK